jgi:hypothetical protein
MHTTRLVIAGGAARVAGCKQDYRLGGGSAADRSPAPSADQVELSILYGSEKKTWLEEQVKAFNASRARAGGKVIRVTARPIGSGEGAVHPLAYWRWWFDTPTNRNGPPGAWPGRGTSGEVGGSAMIRSYSAIEIRSRAASSSSIRAAAIRAAAPGTTTPEKNSLVQPLP